MSNRQKPSIFDVAVSMFGSASDVRPQNAILRNILKAIKNGKYRAVIERLRALSPEEYDKMKKLLPAFIVAGIFYYPRNAGNLAFHSGFIVLDFDDVHNLIEVKFILMQDRHTAVCFISVSGKGLKLIVRVAGITTPEQHKAAFKLIAEYFRSTYGLHLNLDESGKDVSRLCFVSWDPDLYVNEQAEIFSVDVESLSAQPKKPFTAPTSAPTPNIPTNPSQKRKIALCALEKAKESILVAPKGTRHDTRRKYITIVGGYLQQDGLTESEVRAELLPIVLDSSDAPDVAEAEFEEFLQYGAERPIDLENEVRKQREYAARKGGKP
jgi:VirE N-terminal domain